MLQAMAERCSLKIAPKFLVLLSVFAIGVVVMARTFSWKPIEMTQTEQPDNRIIVRSEKSPSQLPAFDSNSLKHANKSKDFVDAINEKYGPVQYKHFRTRDTSLSDEEKEREALCIKNGPKDRAQNGSKFWGKAEHIRRTHHTYLKEENAILMEVGGIPLQL